MNKKYAGLDFPAWFDGKDVNEAAFCREFLSKNKLIYPISMLKSILYSATIPPFFLCIKSPIE